MKKNIIVFFFLFTIIYFFTNGILRTFFQQDEWYLFGDALRLSNGSILNWFKIIGTQHFIPFSELLWLLLYKTFGFQAQYYAFISILLHATASFLVYILSKKLSGSERVGLLTAVLFATNSKAEQAYLHLAVFSHTITSFILILLFFIYAFKASKKLIFNKIDFFILCGLYLSAVLFREDGLLLIPLFPVFLFFYRKETLSKKNLWFFVAFFGVALCYLTLRFALQLLDPSAFNISGSSYISIYLYNLTSLPFKLIVQNLVEGYQTIFLFIYNHHQSLYPVEISLGVVFTVLLDFFILIFFLIFMLFFVILTRGIKQKLFWKNIYFTISLIIFNAILLASVGRRIDLIEGRYLYPSNLAVTFSLSLLIVYSWNLKNSSFLLNIYKKIILLLTIGTLLITNYQRMQIDIKNLQIQSSVRRSMISQIIKLHPTIPKNTIFFVKCREVCYRNSEFGLPNSLVLPFSSGPGWIIMLYYAQNNENAYTPFFSIYNGKIFLWDMGAEGYRKIGNYSFGYFTNMELLRNTIKKENLDKKMVIGLEYDEKNLRIKDNSQNIIKEL